MAAARAATTTTSDVAAGAAVEDAPAVEAALRLQLRASMRVARRPRTVRRLSLLVRGQSQAREALRSAPLLAALPVARAVTMTLVAVTMLTTMMQMTIPSTETLQPPWHTGGSVRPLRGLAVIVSTLLVQERPRVNLAAQLVRRLVALRRQHRVSTLTRAGAEARARGAMTL